MTTSYRIYRDINLFIVKSSGPANLKEILDTLKHLQDDPDFSETYDSLWDAIERTVSFKENDVIALMKFLKPYEFNKNPKRAFLVPSDLHHGMVRMFLTYHYGLNRSNLGIFRERDEAFKWLGIQDPTLLKS